MKPYFISAGDTRVEILPEKGATVVSLCRGGVEYLYRNDENLESNERPRCGIPFLFPIFGRLKDGTYTWEGKSYAMEIHGFAHTSAWAVTGQWEDALELTLETTEETLAMYPFRFRVVLTFRVEEGALSIRQRYENLDNKPMPYNFGFHPYYRVEELSHAQIEANAASYFDFVAGKPVAFGHGTVGLTLPEGAPETGAAFMEAKAPTTLHIPAEGRAVTMEYDGNFPQLVLWTQAGKPFVCVEPVNGTANGLNTGVYRTLNPGESEETTLTIRVA